MSPPFSVSANWCRSWRQMRQRFNVCEAPALRASESAAPAIPQCALALTAPRHRNPPRPAARRSPPVQHNPDHPSKRTHRSSPISVQRSIVAYASACVAAIGHASAASPTRKPQSNVILWPYLNSFPFLCVIQAMEHFAMPENYALRARSLVFPVLRCRHRCALLVAQLAARLSALARH